MKRIDLTGQRFGRLTVIRYDHSEHSGAHWLCKCDCGKEKVAAGYSLRSGNTKSCGCLNSDASRAKLEKAREALKARPRKDLTGQRFGRLVVLGLADVPDRKGFIFWRDVYKRQQKPRRPHRVKPIRLQCRLTESTAQRVKQALERNGIASMQTFLESLVLAWLAQSECFTTWTEKGESAAGGDDTDDAYRKNNLALNSTAKEAELSSVQNVPLP